MKKTSQLDVRCELCNRILNSFIKGTEYPVLVVSPCPKCYDETYDYGYADGTHDTFRDAYCQGMKDADE